MCAGKYTCYSSNTQRKESIEGLQRGAQDGSLHHAKKRTRFPNLEAGSVFFIWICITESFPARSARREPAAFSRGRWARFAQRTAQNASIRARTIRLAAD